MSKYTTEVRYICENYAGLRNSVDYPSIDEVLDKSAPKIFDFAFPIFDNSYRSVLERKILKHYYTREIGEETVGLWKLRLNAKLNEIMPYYNKLYNSELLEFNPLYTVNLTRDKNTGFDSVRMGTENIEDSSKSEEKKEYGWDKEKENDGTLNGTTSVTNANESLSSNVESKVTDTKSDSEGSGTAVNVSTNSGVTDGSNASENANNRVADTQSGTTGEGTSESVKYELYSDTPQGALTGVENETYLTNAKKGTDNGETHSVSQSIGNENVSENGNASGTVHSESSEVASDNGNTTNENHASGNEVVNGASSGSVSENGSENGTRSDITHDEGKEHLIGTDSTNGSVGYTRNKGDSDVVNSTEDYLEHVVGYEGTTGSKMLKEFRETFLNIDMMVINELEPCFFQLW